MLQTVTIDYSQFYLDGVRAHAEPSARFGLASVEHWEEEYPRVLLTALRQYSHVPIDIEVLDSSPAPLGPDWEDVLEFSVTALERPGLSGWENGPDDLRLSLTAGEPYRVRYAIANGDEAHNDSWDPPFAESYLIRIWPEPLSPWRTVAESAAGRYWNFQPAADAAWAEVRTLPEGVRTAAMIERAFREHPESAGPTARGEQRWRLGIAAYTQKVWPHELEHSEIDALILAAAREHADQ